MSGDTPHEMRWSDGRELLVAALVAVASKIEDPVKDRKVQAGSAKKYSYAQLETFMPGIRTLLAEHGCVVIQSSTGTGLLTCISHVSGQWVEGYFPFGSKIADNQDLGAAYSYARRYAILGMLGLVPEGEDTDGVPKKKPAKKKEEPEEKAARQAAHDPGWEADRPGFMAKLQDLGYTYDDVVDFFEARKWTRPSQMTSDRRAKMLAWLGSKDGTTAVAEHRRLTQRSAPREHPDPHANVDDYPSEGEVMPDLGDR